METKSQNLDGRKRNRALYVRYRIYVQKADKADKNYPRRLYKSVRKMHSKITGESLLTSRPHEPEGIHSKTFTPNNLQNVNRDYYFLIAYLSRYFDCYSIWEERLIKGTIEPIRTFTIYGYKQDMLLAYHYITKIINNLNSMRFNMQREYRRKKLNLRKRGKTSNNGHSSLKASNFFYTTLDKLNTILKEILENQAKDPNKTLKLQLIEKKILEEKKLDFKAYKVKRNPVLKDAFCREGKYFNKRVITVN